MASSELLAQIQSGKKLKKAETNDRSAPTLDTAKGGRAASSSAAVGLPMGGPMGGGGPPQLGGLFAGGMPKLKSAGQVSLGMSVLFSQRQKAQFNLNSYASGVREAPNGTEIGHFNLNLFFYASKSSTFEAFNNGSFETFGS
jgi:hypothetical protein